MSRADLKWLFDHFNCQFVSKYLYANNSFSKISYSFFFKVWLWFLGSTFFFILVTVVLIKSKFNQTGGSSLSIYTTAYRQLEYVLKIIANQGIQFRNYKPYCVTPFKTIKTTGYYISYEARTSFKILVGVWLLCMVVLINAYSGVLTSLLTVPKLEPIANTMNGLLESNVLRVTIEKNGGYSRRFLVTYKSQLKARSSMKLK